MNIILFYASENYEENTSTFSGEPRNKSSKNEFPSFGNINFINNNPFSMA